MITSSCSKQSYNFATQGIMPLWIIGHKVEKVLERPGIRSPIDGRGDKIRISLLYSEQVLALYHCCSYQRSGHHKIPMQNHVTPTPPSPPHCHRLWPPQEQHPAHSSFAMGVRVKLPLIPSSLKLMLPPLQFCSLFLS